MDARQRVDLDNHITGHYGEDQFPKPVRYHLPEIGKAPYATVNWLKLKQSLVRAGWVIQERKWFDERESPDRHSHHIEWWNRGRDCVLVYVLDGQASVFKPLKIRALNNAVREH